MSGRRVIIAPDPPRMKMSKPGADADTTVDDNLIFDTGRGNYLGEFQRGLVNYAAFNAGTVYTAAGLTYNDRQASVNLNKAFSSPPHFLLAVRDTIYPVSGEYASTSNLSFGTLVYNTGSGTWSGARFRIWAYTTTTQLVLNIQFVIGSLPVPVAPFTDISFIVFQR